MTNNKTWTAFVLVGIAVLLTGCAEKEQETLRFVAIPAEEQGDQLLYMEPLAQYLSDETGASVEMLVATDYTAAIEALRYGHVELAWLGPFSYVLATQLTDIEPLVGGVREGKTLTYQSIIFTRNDSDIHTLEDIKGKTFAFNDPASTSGYLVPLYAFKKIGLDPETDFAEVSFAGSHMAAQLAVYNKNTDAGASNLPTYEKMVAEGQIDPDIQKIVWESEPIPASPIVVRADLDPQLKAKIKQAFLDSATKMGAVKGVGNKEYVRFEEVKDTDYDVLRDMAEELGLDLTKTE